MLAIPSQPCELPRKLPEQKSLRILREEVEDHDRSNEMVFFFFSKKRKKKKKEKKKAIIML
jgi:hypothetical protein